MPEGTEIPNLSNERDDALVQFLVDLEDHVQDPRSFIDTSRGDLEVEYIAVKDVMGTRIIINKETTPQMWIAEGTLQKPLVVFRDFLRGNKDNRNTYVMHYIGLSKKADGTPVISYVMTHKNLGIRAIIAPIDKPDTVLWDISGTPIYQKKINEI